MSTQIEDIPTMSAAEYVVEVFKRTSRQEDADQWERADALCVAVDSDENSRASAHDYNDGSRRVLEVYWEALQEENEIKEELAISTLAKYRTAALAWPEEDRFKEASFDAHKELAAKKWNGKRVGVMRKLVDRSSKHRVVRNDVRVYKQHKEKKPPVTWDIRIEKRLRSLCLTSDMRPGGPTERGFLAKLLRELAHEVEALNDR